MSGAKIAAFVERSARRKLGDLLRAAAALLDAVEEHEETGNEEWYGALQAAVANSLKVGPDFVQVLEATMAEVSADQRFEPLKLVLVLLDCATKEVSARAARNKR